MTGRGMRGDFWAGGHVMYLDLDASYKICSLNEIYLVPLLSFFVILNEVRSDFLWIKKYRPLIFIQCTDYTKTSQ